MTQKLSEIIEQIPLIDQMQEDISALRESYTGKDEKEAKDTLTKISASADEIKRIYESVVELSQKSVLVRIGRAWDKYTQGTELIDWSDVDKVELQRAMSLDSLAKQLGRGSAERLKGELERDYFATSNAIFHTFLENWSLYQGKLRDFYTMDKMGQKYSGPHLFSKLLQDIEDEVPYEIQQRSIKAMMRQKEKLIERDNALTALSILPEQMVIFFLYSITVMNDKLSERIKTINSLEDLNKQQQLEYDNDIQRLKEFKAQNKAYIDEASTYIQLKLKSDQLKVDNETLRQDNEKMRKEHEAIEQPQETAPIKAKPNMATKKEEKDDDMFKLD